MRAEDPRGAGGGRLRFFGAGGTGSGWGAIAAAMGARDVVEAPAAAAALLLNRCGGRCSSACPDRWAAAAPPRRRRRQDGRGGRRVPGGCPAGESGCAASGVERLPETTWAGEEAAPPSPGLRGQVTEAGRRLPAAALAPFHSSRLLGDRQFNLLGLRSLAAPLGTRGAGCLSPLLKGWGPLSPELCLIYYQALERDKRQPSASASSLGSLPGSRVWKRCWAWAESSWSSFPSLDPGLASAILLSTWQLPCISGLQLPCWLIKCHQIVFDSWWLHRFFSPHYDLSLIFLAFQRKVGFLNKLSNDFEDG